MSENGAGDVVVVGGGLVGSLLSMILANRGFRVTVYERHPDIRNASPTGGRSINLVVTSRGLLALRRAGLEEDVLKLTVPVTGRMIHSLGGTCSYQPYGRDPSECNYSISRRELNALLVSRAEDHGVKFQFRKTLSSATFEAGTPTTRPRLSVSQSTAPSEARVLSICLRRSSRSVSSARCRSISRVE